MWSFYAWPLLLRMFVYLWSSRCEYRLIISTHSFLFMAKGYSTVWRGHNLLPIDPLTDIRAVSGSKMLQGRRDTLSFTSCLCFRSRRTVK